MAKRVRRARAQKPSDEVAYFFLIKHTDQGVKQSAAAKRRGQNAVTRTVKGEHGECVLYSTRGAPYDYVSVMTGISAAAAVRIAGVIESRGTVKATLVSGVRLVGRLSL
jgi:uncharacterized protein with GYD domain